MQSLKEKSALQTDVKAEVDQKNIGGHERSQTKTKADLKLHAVSDFDPGYNSLDSDSGSPVSSTKKPNMKMSDNTKKQINRDTHLSEVTRVKESSANSEQSIEQTLLDKIRRRAESVGDDQSTPVSFVQLHLDSNTEKEPKTTIQPDENASSNDEVKEKGSQSAKDADIDRKVKEGSKDEVEALANEIKANLVLIPRGPEQKRNFDGMPSHPRYQQDRLYAQLEPIRSIHTVTRDGGTPKQPKFIHVPGGCVVRPGSNLKPPSQVPMPPPNVQRFQQPGLSNHNSHNVHMMYEVPPRDYEVTEWPLQSDYFPTNQSVYQQQSLYTTSLISVQGGNSGTVMVKEEPLSPAGGQFSPCHGYKSPEHSQAISKIVDYLKDQSDSDTQSTYSAPSPRSPASPYNKQPVDMYVAGYPDTPPPSVESNDATSPRSLMSCHSDDTMPLSPPQVLSPQQLEPPVVNDDFTLAIMECEQEVNRLSIECLMEQDVEDKDTCLHVVVTQGRYNLALAIAKRLSQFKGALDIQNNLGQTPLFLATVVNMPFLVRDLITLGADPTMKDRSGRTPLHYAAMKGFSTIVRFIHIGLQNTSKLQDFDVDLKDYDGKTPLHYAIEHHGKRETVFTAESQCAMQVFVQNKELISMLLFMHASTVGQDGKSGKTPLHYAVENQKIDLIDLILEYDPESKCVNKQTFSGCTPLHLAVGLKADEPVIVDIVRRLMRKGADVSKENFEKEKPIGLNPRNHSLVRKVLSGQC